jgi:hypothetical protein
VLTRHHVSTRHHVLTFPLVYQSSTVIGLNDAMFGTNLTLKEQLLAGAAMALTFAVCYVAGLQAGGHW